jgi:hypothetical protein
MDGATVINSMTVADLFVCSVAVAPMTPDDLAMAGARIRASVAHLSPGHRLLAALFFILAECDVRPHDLGGN